MIDRAAADVGLPRLTVPGAYRRAGMILTSSRRAVLGLAGPPGAGKSTIAQRLVQELRRGPAGPDAVAYAPMDGFHLADAELVRRGLRDRKGAPETFDGAGYVALLARVASDPDTVHWAPAFDRAREVTVPRAHRIAPAVRLVVTEGNYLLLDVPPWNALTGICAEIWFVPVDDAAERQRLMARARRGGRDPATARRWVERTQLPNARLVNASAARADAVLSLTGWKPPRRRPN